jgi:DNA-binding NarL/FixJ family response regulator
MRSHTAQTPIRAQALSVVMVSPGNLRPDCTNVLSLRLTAEPAGVRDSDDVVILAGAGAGLRVGGLIAHLGAAAPPVLVLAPTFDPADVYAALQHGATSYLLEGECTHALAGAVRATANRTSWVGPAAASMLVHRLRGAPPRDLPGRVILTRREREIMAMIADGYSSTEVAGRLRLREKTIRNNLTNVYAKLQVRGMTEAVLVWMGRPSQGRRSA